MYIKSFLKLHLLPQGRRHASLRSCECCQHYSKHEAVGTPKISTRNDDADRLRCPG